MDCCKDFEKVLHRSTVYVTEKAIVKDVIVVYLASLISV